MGFVSFEFLALIIIGSLLFYSFSMQWWRLLVFSTMNIIFVISYASGISTLIPLVGFMAVGYFGLMVIHYFQTKWAVSLFVIMFVIIFAYLKDYAFIPSSIEMPINYIVIGFSYILFRVIQIAIDLYQKNIEKMPSPLEFFNFTCSFLTFSSGPIQRYQDFELQTDRLVEVRLSEKQLLENFSRLVNGLIKLAVVSKIITNLISTCEAHEIATRLPWFSFLFVSFFYMLFIYMNFSGYMDIAIGIGSIFGFHLPENFNFPSVANNFMEFWSRWHMSYSSWFKTYCFNPIVKFFMSRFGHRKKIAPYWGVIAFFITFLLMGIWHGSTTIFVIYGLFLAVGVSFNKLYEVILRDIIGKKRFKKLRQNTGYMYFCRGMTTMYFCFALTCLRVNTDQLLVLWKDLGLVTFLWIFFSMSFAIGIIWLVYYKIKSVVKIAPYSINLDKIVPLIHPYGIAFRIIIFALFVMQEPEIPGFVYEVF